MANYKNITIDEMRSFLQKGKGWHEESRGRDKEAVFQYPLKRFPNILVKVYTGIKQDTGVSRGVGRDAIRVCAVNVKGDEQKGFIKARRVHRVFGWEKNLRNRVVQVIIESNERASQLNFNYGKR